MVCCCEYQKVHTCRIVMVLCIILFLSYTLGANLWYVCVRENILKEGGRDREGER